VFGEQLSLAGLGDALGDVLLGQAGQRFGPAGRGARPPGGSSGGKRSVSISEAEPFRDGQDPEAEDSRARAVRQERPGGKGV